MDLRDDPYVGLVSSKGYKYTCAYPNMILQLRGNRIGKEAVKRQGQYDVRVPHGRDLEIVSSSNLPGVELTVFLEILRSTHHCELTSLTKGKVVINRYLQMTK